MFVSVGGCGSWDGRQGIEIRIGKVITRDVSLVDRSVWADFSGFGEGVHGSKCIL